MNETDSRNMPHIIIEKCRICLKAGGIPIFGDDENADISEEVTVFGGIQIRADDNFPQNLCMRCHTLLQSAVLFRKTANQSDLRLRCNQLKVPDNKDKIQINNVPYVQTQDTMKIAKCVDENNAVVIYFSDDESSNEKYSCKICNFQFRSMETYNKHNLVNHNMGIEGSENITNKIECMICKKSYNSLYYKEHMKRTHSVDVKKQTPSKVSCPICKKIYKKQYMKSHMQTHDRNGLEYICEHCGRRFIQATALKLHSLTHTNEMSHKCQFCPYRGRHAGLLKVHIRTHLMDYQYKCTECSASFITKSNLSKHLLRHRGPVDFTCESCNRGFYSKLELQRHVKVQHLGIKNYTCNICGKAFGYRNGMMCHQLKVHKRKKLTTGKGRVPLYLELESKTQQNELIEDNIST